jgi:speckle-type POZ protein
MPSSNLPVFFSLQLVIYQNIPLTNDSFAEFNTKFFNSTDLSDIAIVCDGKEIPAHSCIIAARSPVFEAMLKSGMRESNTNRIVIEDIDAATMIELLRYIYMNKAENLNLIALRLIYAAEKYDLPGLKSMCASKLMDLITERNVFEYLVLADRFGEKKLLMSCIDFIDK